MVIEIADLRVQPGQREAFARALAEGLRTIISKAQGYRRHMVLAGVESPGRFLLHIEWDTLEAHTVGFRQSPAFTQWRALVGPFFAEPPQVEHFEVVDQG